MYGIIDIGSNTIRLKVYKCVKGKYKAIIDKKEFAKLISYRNNNSLTEDGVNLCIDILDEYKQILNMLKVSSFYAFATASLRYIDNENEVLNMIKEKTGIDVKILSGDEEAYYGYLGAKMAISFDTGAVVDIGGGSMEITFFKDKEIIDKKSIRCGSLNMQELFLKNDSIIDFETKSMKDYILNALNEEKIDKKSEIVYGVGGTIRALLKIKRKETGLEVFEFSYDDVKRWYKMLKLNSTNWLRLVLNVVPERTYTISCGLIILKTIMKHIEAKRVIVSEYGVREGYLLHLIEDNK